MIQIMCWKRVGGRWKFTCCWTQLCTTTVVKLGTCSRDSSVGIAGFDSSQQRIPVLGDHQPPIQRVLWALSPVVKQLTTYLHLMTRSIMVVLYLHSFIHFLN
jgi:hypothetical protein